MNLQIETFKDDALEQAVIAHLLQNSQVDSITSTFEDWYLTNPLFLNVYKLCYEYIVGVGRGAVDYNSIVNILVEKGKAVGDNLACLNYLRTIDPRSYPNIDFAMEKLKKLALRRRYIVAMNRHLAAAQNPDNDIDQIMLETEDELLAIERGAGHKLEVFTGQQIIERRQAGLWERYHSKGIYTYWPHVDEKLSVGFAPGKMTVIAGRTSMGKSFFKTNLIINQCRNGIGVLNVCPEQGFDSEHDRLDAVLSGVHLNAISRIREWQIGDEKFQLLKNSSIAASQSRYSCVPTRAITVAGIQTTLRRLRRMGMPINIVYIDLFDRLGDVNVATDRTGTISVKLNQLEQIAEVEKVHMVPLVQINRATESRKDKRPTLGDLRDCGNFEQDADMVFLLYREGYYDETLEDNMLDVTIAKQRDGVRGVTLQFMLLDKQTLAITPAGEKKVISADG